MAAQTCAVAQHATLSGTTADTVAFTGVGSFLAITNRSASGSAAIYFRVDGTAAVSAADNTYVVLPQQTKVLGPNRFGPSTSLSIVGSGNDYSAEIF